MYNELSCGNGYPFLNTSFRRWERRHLVKILRARFDELGSRRHLQLEIVEPKYTAFMRNFEIRKIYL